MDKKSMILEALYNIGSPHYLPGPVYQMTHQFEALMNTENNELETIYRLTEAHAPNLRRKTILRYEKVLTSLSSKPNDQPPLSKNCVDFNCSHIKIEERVECMLTKLREMPKEWTLVQITPGFNPYSNITTDPKRFYTSPLYLTVFNCGENQMKPFYIKVEAPRSSVNGEPVELTQEIHSIISDNKDILMSAKNRGVFRNVEEKQSYFSQRQSIDERLKTIVKELQNLYLKEWRCLLVGKYVDEKLDAKILKKIQSFLKNEIINYDDKVVSILFYLVKGCQHIGIQEMKRAMQYLFLNDKNLQKNAIRFIKDLSDQLSLPRQKKHPIILIIEDSLDFFPWEMMDILIDEPVSRMPSFHFAYALFKEHEKSIKGGFKIIENPEKGTFIINPDLDLKNMENRITSFVNYWSPQWEGLSGSKPTEEQFEQTLTSGEIFSYHGHGSGTQFLSMQKIQKLRVNAVVLLFGCGSMKLNQVGPQTDFYGTYQMYLIACSPCVVGMLWEVTDLDTDLLTTEFMSQWIPNREKTHWKHIDKSKWSKGAKVDLSKEKIVGENLNYHESDLLRALSLSKRANLCFYLTKAACVARGIPVKIKS